MFKCSNGFIGSVPMKALNINHQPDDCCRPCPLLMDPPALITLPAATSYLSTDRIFSIFSCDCVCLNTILITSLYKKLQSYNLNFIIYFLQLLLVLISISFSRFKQIRDVMEILLLSSIWPSTVFKICLDFILSYFLCEYSVLPNTVF